MALQPEQVSAYTYLIPVLVLLCDQLLGALIPWQQIGWGVAGVLATMVVMVRTPAYVARRIPVSENG